MDLIGSQPLTDELDRGTERYERYDTDRLGQERTIDDGPDLDPVAQCAMCLSSGAIYSGSARRNLTGDAPAVVAKPRESLSRRPEHTIRTSGTWESSEFTSRGDGRRSECSLWCRPNAHE